MQDEYDGPTGLPKLRWIVERGLEHSEMMAIRKGTDFVESEYEFVAAIKLLAREFGGDITDPQWYAGAISMASLFASLSEGHPLLMMILPDYIRSVQDAIGRLHDQIVKEGVVVFDGK